jgi:hypothetical protein
MVSAKGNKSIMHKLLLILSLSLTGCGTYGLQVFDTGSFSSTLVIDPEGEIQFGEHSSALEKPVRKEVVLWVDGEDPLAIVDVYLDGSSSEVFGLSDDLPLPIRLHPAGSFPLQLKFLPSAAGSYRGELVVLVDDGTEDGAYIHRSIQGLGCDDSGQSGDC